jgi:hypothetical protein
VIVRSEIWAKAERADMRSDAIVVSFDHAWYGPLNRREFSAVLRKRVPTTFKPSWIYFHINTPKSAICARTSLKRIDRLDLNSAIGIAHLLRLSQNEITKYFGHSHSSIGVYFLDRIELAPVEASKDRLAGRLIYNPPQSFFALSTSAKEIIDDICGFQNYGSGRRSEKHA